MTLITKASSLAKILLISPNTFTTFSLLEFKKLGLAIVISLVFGLLSSLTNHILVTQAISTNQCQLFCAKQRSDAPLLKFIFDFIE